MRGSPLHPAIVALVLVALAGGCREAPGSAPMGAPERAPAAAPSPPASPAPTPVGLRTGESVRLTAQPYPHVRIEEVTEPLRDGQLDDQRSTLLYDRETERLYLLDGVWAFCFLPGEPGGRRAALATSGVDYADPQDERGLLISFDPLEVFVLDVRLHNYCRESPTSSLQFADIEVWSCCLEPGPVVAGRELPPGGYDLDPETLTLTFVHGPYAPRGTLERWSIDGRTVDLVREEGALRLGRLVEQVQQYRLSPDERLLALTGLWEARDAGLHLVVLATSTTTTVAHTPPHHFEWSPDSRWIAAWWPDPVLERTGATYLIEIVEREPAAHWYEPGQRIGPLEDRFPVGWIERADGGGALLLLRSMDYPDRVLELFDPAIGEAAVLARIPQLLSHGLAPGSDVIATSAWSESFALYLLADGARTVPAPLAGVELGILDFSWSEDGRWLAAYRAPGRS